MTNTLSLNAETMSNLRNDLRIDVLPEIFEYISEKAIDIFLQNDIPIDLTGLTNYAEIESALALHKEKSILHISDIIRQTLAEMLSESRTLPTSTPSHTANELGSIPLDNESDPIPTPDELEAMYQSSLEAIRKPKSDEDTPREFDNEPREFEPGPPPPEMPISTARQIIKDRVDDETITDIVFLAAEPDQFTPAEIRRKGIKLDEQIIQVIIDDNEHRINGVIAARSRYTQLTTNDYKMTDDEINAQPLNDYKIREIKRMYKKGHTIEHIASETELSETDVLEVTDEINPKDIQPSLTTIAMIKGMKENDDDLDKIAEICKLRPEFVQSLNGSQ